MGIFDGLEKLINEHGSATILKERLSLAKEQYAALESENAILKQKIKELQSEIKILKTENQTLKLNYQQATQKIGLLENQISTIHNNNPEGYVCDHCASSSLTRIGSRPDPTFGDLGIKQKMFSCDECGKESAFTQRDNNI